MENDPDAADSIALETASHLPEEPNEMDLGPATDRELQEAGLQITGLRTLGGPGTARKFSGLFSSDDDSSDDSSSLDEDEAGRDQTLDREGDDFEDNEASPSGVGRRRSQKDGKRRRPSTTEAKARTPLDDEDDDEDDDEADISNAMDKKMVLGEGPFADPVEMDDDSSDEGELVEIRPRRTS